MPLLKCAMGDVEKQLPTSIAPMVPQVPLSSCSSVDRSRVTRNNDNLSLSTDEMMIIAPATAALDADDEVSDFIHDEGSGGDCPINNDHDNSSTTQKEKEQTLSNTTNDTNSTRNSWCNNKNNFSFSSIHSKVVSHLTSPLVNFVVFLSKSAAMHPTAYVTILPLINFILIAVGFFTNFTQDLSAEECWTAVNSKTFEHGEWIRSVESGFPNDARVATLIVHANGKNMLGEDSEEGNNTNNKAKEGLQRVFEALDTIRSIPGYEEMCSYSGYHTTTNPISNEVSCSTLGVSLLYYDDYEYFLDNFASDEDVVKALSSPTYPNGLEVDRDRIIGNNRFNENENDQDTVLEYAESYVSFISLPGEEQIKEEVMKFETIMIEKLLQLQSQWEEEESSAGGSYFILEILAYRSFDDEFLRVIVVDLPLLIASALLMMGLCITAFHRHGDRVQSRKWLGFGAVVTLFFSVMSSFGLLFCLGVPFTNLTPMVPFIIFGVGLDDTFIIFGSYLRMDPRLGPVERVERTMKEVAPAIILTTLTSATAFALGLISSIPTVKWLVYYAFTSILVDFFFQVTFFIALVVLDERRIQSNRLDCCFCCTASSNDVIASIGYDKKRHFSARVMTSYGKWLLKGPISIAVIVVFVGMFGVFAWSTTQLTQYFEVTQIIPQDSYIQTWWSSWTNLYSANGVPVGVYFRDVDFSDPEIQSQMKSYVRELSDSPYVGSGYPERFWIEDLETYVSVYGLQNLSFEEQLDSFLQIPAVEELYGSEITRDSSGKVTSSRTHLRLDNLVGSTIRDKVKFVHSEREITLNQEVNKDLDEWKFFTWSGDYYKFDFYSNCPQEFATSTIIGVVSVTALALLFIPYWPCALITGVSIAMLNIDLLGFMQFMDVMISPMSYILCIMSIGLMVDHVMHVTVRYMEIASRDRKQRVQETLETMGASILLGGVSTSFGVLPLAGASSEAFRMMFIIFFGVVLLGVLHGLMFLPAVFSFIGPLGSISCEPNYACHKGIWKESSSSSTIVESDKDDLSESTDLSENLDDREKRAAKPPCEETARPPASLSSTEDCQSNFAQVQVVSRVPSLDNNHQTTAQSKELISSSSQAPNEGIALSKNVEISVRNTVEEFMNSMNDLLCFGER